MAGSSRSKKGTTKSPQSPQSPKRKRKGKAAAETKSVDANDEDYNIRSPKRTRLLTQIGGTTKSFEGGRKSKAAAETKSVDVNDEDYNIRSPKRTRLLTQIGGTTKSLEGVRKSKAAETKSVDVNNEDYNLRSSERIRLLTKIGGPTKSPEGGRKAKAAAAPKTRSVDVNNEDYNIRSPERTQLLTQIKERLNNAPVSPAFWACCQLADMDCLQEIATLTRKMIVYLQGPITSLPLQWNQRLRDSVISGSEAGLQSLEGLKKRKLNSNLRLSVPRSVRQADNCKERDGHKCILTRTPGPQAAHIFPHCMLQPRPKPDRNRVSAAIPDFWKNLGMFWDEDQVNKWKNIIFPDGVGIESCFNLISLSPSAHEMWNKGLFALKPLELSRDQKTLTVQFFWQVPGNYKIDDKVDLLTETLSSDGLELVGDGYHLTRVQNDGSTLRAIYSGETLTFTTKDPENLPLPSIELLEMQWVLQRLVGMCGAAEWPSLDEIYDDAVDDDDCCLVPDHTDYSVHNSLKKVREWVYAEEAASMTPEMATLHSSVIECH